MLREGLNVHQVTFPHVHKIRDSIRVPRKSFLDRSVKSIRVLLFKPRFHFARLDSWQFLSYSQKILIRTKESLALWVKVLISEHHT